MIYFKLLFLIKYLILIIIPYYSLLFIYKNGINQKWLG